MTEIPEHLMQRAREARLKGTRTSGELNITVPTTRLPTESELWEPKLSLEVAQVIDKLAAGYDDAEPISGSERACIVAARRIIDAVKDQRMSSLKMLIDEYGISKEEIDDLFDE